MPNFANSRLYLVVNDVNNVKYVGCTTRSLAERYAEHRKRARNNYTCMRLHTAMREIGIDHFRIILIRNVPCQNREQLSALEYAEMAKYPKEELYNVDVSVQARHDRAVCDEALEHLRRLGEERRGVPLSQETKDKVSAWWYGLSDEKQEEWRAARKTPEFQASHAVAAEKRKGVPVREEVRVKMVERARARATKTALVRGNITVSWHEGKQAYNIRDGHRYVKSFTAIMRGTRARTKEQALELAIAWMNENHPEPASVHQPAETVAA